MTTLSGEEAKSVDKAHTVVIKIRTSKTDQVGQGAIRRHGRSGSTKLCPVLAAWNLVQSARHNGIPVTSPISTYKNEADKVCNISPSKVSIFLRRGMSATSKFAPHSLRIGGATAMLQAGCTDIEIKTFGRWQSDAFLAYLRANYTMNLALANAMIQ